ncbi:MAG: Heme/hemopexin-binding protein [Verrucomicrobiales bacterium]|nr:Heme/hemopexin-binding protein [Verrucomicrobiales bacterium]
MIFYPHALRAAAPHFWMILSVSFLFSLVSSSAGTRTILSGPQDSEGFGATITVLPNGNLVVTDPYCNGERGAVYLYDGASLGIISVLTGGSLQDKAGIGGVTVLANGNFLVRSPEWRVGRGAVTWGSCVSGVSGEISAANSLTNSSSGIVTLLNNGNYTVYCPQINDTEGAVTWGSGNTGVSGEVSASNSLIISGLSAVYIKPLSNGNYVVCSPSWNERRGAVTWCSGAAMTAGAVSAANSLVGSTPLDEIGRHEGYWTPTAITLLSNGNYTVSSPAWNGARGAVTWGSGTSGVTGEVSAANSLVGTLAGDSVGGGYYNMSVTPLNNGNFVVHSPSWHDSRGAVTWGNGGTGLAGEISVSNSLVGTQSGDGVGSFSSTIISGIFPLINGNYVVCTRRSDRDNGAVTWGDGTAGVTGVISLSNSLIGSGVGASGITPLVNGNYVVSAAGWGERAGAVVWVNGATGMTGEVTAANALVGTAGNILALSTGNYLVCNPQWRVLRGAVTFGNGVSGTTGEVSAANSLIGTHEYSMIGAGGVTLLSNGNYVVNSPIWKGPLAAATWGSGTSGVTGEVSLENSLIGATESGSFNAIRLIALRNGNYLVWSPGWNGSRGAVTWGSGTSGVTGETSAANSLVGTEIADNIGLMTGDSMIGREMGVKELSNGNYVVRSPQWNDGRGAVTWGDGNAGVKGEISAANSLVGSLKGDFAGYSPELITLVNGNYLVESPLWNGRKGAITWGSGEAGACGEISASNSLVATNDADNAGLHAASILTLDNGHYLVRHDGRLGGSLTIGDGFAGTRGYVNIYNTVFRASHPYLRSWAYTFDPVGNRLLAASLPVDNQITVVDFAPDIKVEGQPGADVRNESLPADVRNTNMGSVAVQGGSRTGTYRIFDAGSLRLFLSGSPKVEITGDSAEDFTVTKQPGDFSAEESLTPFEITFDPSELGPRSAVVRIVNNTADSNPFQFTLSGIGVSGTIFSSWCESFFGGALRNKGILEDFDSDAVCNLLEFAFGTVPTSAGSGPGPLHYSGHLSGGGSLDAVGGPVAAAENGEFSALFIRRQDHAAAGLVYTPQFSGNMIDWRNSFDEPIVLATGGGCEIVKVPWPQLATGEGAKCFFRVSVKLAL